MNACTEEECTDYHFDIVISDIDPNHPSPSFHGALDLFTNLLNTPLFSEIAMNREIKAVTSEHQANELFDGHRIYEVQKLASNPGHPISKFHAGNEETVH